MDRSTTNTSEGEAPREYIVRMLYADSPYDAFNSKTCTRLIRLAHKDVNDLIDTLRVKEIKRLEGWRLAMRIRIERAI